MAVRRTIDGIVERMNNARREEQGGVSEAIYVPLPFAPLLNREGEYGRVEGDRRRRVHLHGEVHGNFLFRLDDGIRVVPADRLRVALLSSDQQQKTVMWDASQPDLRWNFRSDISFHIWSKRVAALARRCPQQPGV